MMLRAIWWEDSKLHLLDQRRLPMEEVYIHASSCQQVERAIADMVVRGAPAIGIAAAYGFVLAWRDYGTSVEAFHKAVDQLAMARPTAVNLLHAIKFMQRALARYQSQDADHGQCYELLLGEALGYHEADIAVNTSIGERGAEVLLGTEDTGGEISGNHKLRMVTYCNTGSLATGGYGTALGIIRSLHKAGRIEKVYACETRPFLQGARLTAYELSKDGIPYELITDNMVAWLCTTRQIDAMVVGADRIARNGDTANKIGTLQLALIAQHFKVPFLVAAPVSTIDLDIETGTSIPVELRNQNEVLGFRDVRWAPEGAVAWNPSFDVTPGRLIHRIVTEKVVIDPSRESITPDLLR